MTRVAVLGGSAISTPQLAAALADDGTAGIELALVGRSERKLALVAVAARVAGRGSVAVSEHTELERALEGASIVLSQIRVGGLEGRSFDERFSRDLGIPGEETVGPGGFSAAYRTLPVVHELMRRVRQVAPEAYVINLTNPASLVHRVTERIGLPTITVCDAPLVLADRLTALLGADPAVAHARYSGMNHCGWVTGLDLDGVDRLGDVLARGTDVAALTGVDEQVTTWLHAVPNPYLKFLYHPDRQLQLQRSRPRPRALELEELETKALREYALTGDPSAAATRRPAPWYSRCVVPLIWSIASGERIRTIVNVTNRGLLHFLSVDTTIEIAAEVQGGVVMPLPPESLPPDARAILAQVAAYDDLAVDAILDGDRDGCVRALTAHPLVSSVDIARELFDRIERWRPC